MNTATQNKSSKLARYTAVAGAVIAGSNVNAQIVYTDLVPDVVLDTLSAPYMLDFNNDASPDLVFGAQHFIGSGSQSGIQFTYIGNGAVVGIPAGNALIGVAGSSSAFDLTALNAGDPISSAQNFGASSSNALALNAVINAGIAGTFPVTQGNFIGVSNKFLGAHFAIAGATHYGWVQLSVNQLADQLTIHDYAYNATADAALNAGQMVGLENVKVEDKVTIFTTLNNANINVTPDLIGGNILMVAMNGAIVSTKKITDVNTAITFEGIETGIYTISAQFEGGNVSKRVYIK